MYSGRQQLAQGELIRLGCIHGAKRRLRRPRSDLARASAIFCVLGSENRCFLTISVKNAKNFPALHADLTRAARPHSLTIVSRSSQVLHAGTAAVQQVQQRYSGHA